MCYKKHILLDTSFLIAYLNKDDSFHKDAIAIKELLEGNSLKPVFVITDYIYCETLQRLSSCKAAISLVPKAAKEMCDTFKIFNVNEKMFEASYKLFIEKNKYGYYMSFIDCSSAGFIRDIRKKENKDKRINIDAVIAFDKHYNELANEIKFKVIDQNNISKLSE